MKTFNFSLLTFNLFNRAYNSLKEWCDPAFEGSPYTNEHKVKTGFKPVSMWSNHIGFRQRMVLRRV